MEPVLATIKNGTVIDHINANQALAIADFLSLINDRQQITIGINLKSNQMGLKDIIKVTNWEISVETANQIACFAPLATINIIRKGKVQTKYIVTLPKEIESIIPCSNSKCITNGEKHLAKLIVIQMIGNKLKMKCRYCGTIYSNK